MAVDRLFKRQYKRFFDYALAKKFYKKEGFKNVYQYGPTPLLTLAKVVQAFGLKKGQKLIDLGCGTARHLYFLYHIFGIECTGVEMIEGFFRFARSFSSGVDVNIECKNMLEVSLEGADWALFFATSFDDDFINKMIDKFLQAPRSLKIITTSFSLSEYSNSFETLDSIDVRYPWGKTKAYLNIKKD